MLEQFVGFVLCGLTIVAGDGDGQIVWEHVAAERVDLVQHQLGNNCRVGGFAFRKRDGHCRMIRDHYLCAPPRASQTRRRCGLSWTVFELLGYIAQVDGSAPVDTDHHLAQVVEAREEGPCFDLKLTVVARERPACPRVFAPWSCHTMSLGVRP